jgi:hypothetical protein
MQTCMAHGELPPSEEIRELWLLIAGSYRFLLEREERIETDTRQTSALVGRFSAPTG